MADAVTAGYSMAGAPWQVKPSSAADGDPGTVLRHLCLDRVETASAGRDCDGAASYGIWCFVCDVWA